MTKTVTAVFASADAVRNALDDLVATGIDREKVFADQDNKLVKVMIPDAVESEVKEILNRHGPVEVK